MSDSKYIYIVTTDTYEEFKIIAVYRNKQEAQSYAYEKEREVTTEFVVSVEEHEVRGENDK